MTEPRLTMDVVREELRKYVTEASLRSMAETIDMSFSGLRSFLDGSSPQKKTRLKLVRWYYSRAQRSSAPPREELETAIALMRRYLGDESKPRRVRERRFQEVVNRLKEEMK